MDILDRISFLIVFFIIYFAIKFLSKLRQQDVFKDRIQDLSQYQETLSKIPTERVKLYRHSTEGNNSLFQKIVNKIQSISSKEQEKLKMIFQKAGFRTEHALLWYQTIKMLMIFLPTIIAFVFVFYFTNWQILFKILTILGSAVFGSYTVDLVLHSLVAARQERIRKAFPSAIDLMVLCTEAGLSLAATVERTAREISQLSPDLGYELALLSIELNMLSDERKALQRFSDRLDAPAFKAVVANIMQAEEYGTPIAQAMRALSEQFRQDRLVEAEERAAKLPTLISLPMMLLIFPCIYIILLGPAVINIMNTFQK